MDGRTMNEEKRNKLKIIVILFLIGFFVIYGTSMYLKYASTKINKGGNENINNSVIFAQPNLQIFDYKEQLNAYPDRVSIHYPYLIVVHPDKFISQIYNLETKQKEKKITEVVLDYFKGNSVYNKQGYVTHYNNKNLGLLCDRAFIKSSKEILCIIRPDINKQDNKLISINSQTLEQKDIYTSQNVLTAIYFDKETLYIGEYNFVTNKAFITVNNKTTPIDDLVNIIYPMDNKMYAGSFKSLRNNQSESYYEIINNNNNLATKLVGKNKIVFYY